jgi:uncharacterized membrane protein (DUF373 family)
MPMPGVHKKIQQTQNRCAFFGRLILSVGRHCGLAVNAALSRRSNPMVPYLDRFERIITRALLIMLVVVVVLATVELAWILGKELLVPPYILLAPDQLLGLFGQFLLVLIGIELLHSMKVYAVHRVIHLEAVLIVAMIAVARKVIVLETKEQPEGTLLGIAAITLALTLGYYLVRRSHQKKGDTDPESKG